MPVVIVVVENQIQFMNMLSHMVLYTLLANNMMLTILSTRVVNVSQLTSAKTVHGHHAQLDKLVKINVGLLKLRNIMSVIIMVLLALLK